MEMPIGYRFDPTDYELVWFYLRPKINKIALPIDLAMDFNVYELPPWELPRMDIDACGDQYYYVSREMKTKNGSRPNRFVTERGWWKATVGDKSVFNKQGREVGNMKPLTFFLYPDSQKSTKDGKKTNWIMHEYSLMISTSSSKGNINKFHNCVLCWIRESGRGGLETSDLIQRNENQQNMISSSFLEQPCHPNAIDEPDHMVEPQQLFHDQQLFHIPSPQEASNQQLLPQLPSHISPLLEQPHFHAGEFTNGFLPYQHQPVNNSEGVCCLDKDNIGELAIPTPNVGVKPQPPQETSNSSSIHNLELDWNFHAAESFWADDQYKLQYYGVSCPIEDLPINVSMFDNFSFSNSGTNDN